MLGRAVRVRWTASVAGRPDLGGSDSRVVSRVEFHIALRIVSAHHALLDAWLETPGGMKSLLERQPVTCTRATADDLVHIDAHLDGRRVLAVSMRTGAGSAIQGDRLLYAQSALLADAGFTAGSYDPPSARIPPAEHDAASA